MDLGEPGEGLLLVASAGPSVHALGPRLDRLGSRQLNRKDFLMIDTGRPIGIPAPYVPRTG